MKSVHRFATLLSLLICCGVVVATARPALAASINVAMVPSTTTVAPGTEFEVRVRVTNPGVEFNTYEAYVAFDPARLAFLPASPLALQEGPYMTNACGNTFHVFQAQPDALHITHAILCANQYLVTQGDVYVLRFRALGTAGTTSIRLQQVQFMRGVNPAEVGALTDATIQVTQPTDVGGPLASRLQLQVAPNPFNPTTVVAIESPAAGYQRVIVHDVRGQEIGILQSGSFPAGARRIVWDGRGADGERLASGAYIVTLATAQGSRSQRVVLLK